MALEDPEQEKLLKPRKRASKYGNEKIVVDDLFTFDSKAEAAFFITNRGETIVLKPVFKFSSGVKYIPDFIIMKDGTPLQYMQKFFKAANQNQPQAMMKLFSACRPMVKFCRVVDVKGIVTAACAIKLKLMKDEFGVDVELVKIDAQQADTVIKGYLGARAKCGIK